MSSCLRSTIERLRRSWSRAQTSDALTRTPCAATSTSPSRSSSLPPRSSASVGVRVEQRLLQLAVLAPVTDRGRALRLLAERTDVDLSIAALALLFGGGGIAHLSCSKAAAPPVSRIRPTRRPSDVVIGELSSL